MDVRAVWLAASLLGGCTFGSLTGGGGSVTIGGDDGEGSGTGPGSGDDPTMGPAGDDGPSDGTVATDDTTDGSAGCPIGTEGCECGDGGTCEGGLQCVRGACVLATCGNGDRDPGELCDDGNLDFGDGCDACEPTPGVKSIVGGWLHTCALLWSGGVRCWGEAADGRLGYGDGERIGDNEHPFEAADVPLGGNAVALSAGSNFTCALLDDASVRCWGDHAAGRLGNQSSEPIGDNEPASASPEIVLGGGAVQIASGDSHTCAVLEDNSVRCWGEGGQGRLGHGNQDDIGLDDDPADTLPVDVGADVKHVSAGGEHTCAVTVEDEVVCWGNGANGRLGYGDNVSIAESGGEVPADAGRVPVGASVQAVRVGEQHTCVLLLGGGVRCWGQNSAGQCGIEGGGSIGDAAGETPDMLADIPLGEPAVSIGVRGLHSCAVLESGTVKCWGAGALGRLGYGSEDDVFTPPATPVAISADQLVARVVPGGEHTCALLDLGNVRCWGRGDTGALGYASVESIADMPGESPESMGDVAILDP
jgi:cysteine-rich repeat protein